MVEKLEDIKQNIRQQVNKRNKRKNPSGENKIAKVKQNPTGLIRPR
jgi:hypothetical protein